ncbi:hypothetical protein [Aquabacterium sp.]|uniref:hypothetical protein n=1 Tax=Aquabacterium sp. TaxID=1872578 RepID=UPI0025BB670B|nr:hypothetical protein [Aquabacterium sp.]
MAKIIHTDNFADDYPNEKFVEGLPILTIEQAKAIAEAINKALDPSNSGMYPRHYVVCSDNYVLKPGFEP